MKKNKLILTSLAGLSLAATSVSAVACSVAEDSKVIFQVSFTRDKSQWNALEDLVKYYNENIVKPERDKLLKELEAAKTAKDSEKEKQITEKLSSTLEVELSHGGSGYTLGDAKITTDLENKNTKGLANLTVNYAPTLARIVQYGKQLDFSNSEFGEHALNRNLFDEEYVKVNDKISGADSGKFYQLPLLKSTVVFNLNGPVFKTIFKTIADAGVTVAESIKKEFNLDNTKWDEDVTYIKSAEMFGNPDTNEKIVQLFKDITVDETIFSDFTSLIKFAMAAAQSFPHKSSDINIIGVDDINGLIAPILYGSNTVSGDDTKMPISVVKDSEGKTIISFDKLLDKNDETTKKFVEIYNLIKDAIAVKALRIYGGGAFASVDSVNHKIAGSFGSTAGYSYNFNKASDPYIEFINQADSTKNFKVTSANFGLITETGTKKEVKLGRYSNEILPGDRGTKNYDIYPADEETKAKLSELSNGKYLVKVSASETDKIAVLDSLSDLFKKVGNFKIVNTKNTDGSKDATEVVYVTAQDFSAPLKVEGKFEHVIPSLSKSLQESEIVAKQQIGKLVKEDTKTATFLQGPNLFGISKSKELDLATVKFVKFLTSSTQIDLPKSDTKKEGVDRWAEVVTETPFEHITRIASYIVPYKGFESNESFTKTSNKYLKVAAEVFKKVSQEGSNVILYEEPSSVYANPFRNGIQAIFGGLSSKIEAGIDPTYEDAVISSLSPIVSKFQK